MNRTDVNFISDWLVNTRRMFIQDNTDSIPNWNAESILDFLAVDIKTNELWDCQVGDKCNLSKVLNFFQSNERTLYLRETNPTYFTIKKVLFTIPYDLNNFGVEAFKNLEVEIFDLGEIVKDNIEFTKRIQKSHPHEE